MPTLDDDIQAMLDERARTMAEFSADHRPMAMYALYRTDLQMPTGKLVAQCGHAYDMAHERAKLERPEVTAQYRGTGNGTKLVMYGKNIGQLTRAYKEARAAGLPCELIIDRGHILLPHFTGRPIITAVGIGPVYKDEVAAITKRFTLAR
jgi:peptidyl-tRNA hydrolase